MKVKKKTVWFLTLFSLIAVVSVYYVVEGNRTADILSVFTDNTLDETSILGMDEQQTVNSESDLFQGLRLEVSNQRSQLREQLTQKVASEQYTAEEKNAAFNEMEALIKQESAEAMLEMLIKAIGYSDVLVRMENDNVTVSVMADEMSKQQANEIVYIVRSEIDHSVEVTVDMQPHF